jgi:redox-sensitive bicupin YhaK (pirin superfamily)
MMIDVILDQHRKDLGGFEIGRVLPQVRRRSVGPFVFFDHMGPAQFQPGFARTVDVRPHPHIGLSTLSYLFEGAMTHRDSVGSDIVIRPGEVNWMTAGSGITHSERFEDLRRTGGALDGIQTWLALPVEHEETSPSFSHHAGDELPIFTDKGLRGCLIAGEAYGIKSAVPVFSPLFYVHWRLLAGARVEMPAGYPEGAAYLAKGSVEVDGQLLKPGQMAVFGPAHGATFTAGEDSSLMLLGGESVGPRFLDWNFVSSSLERIEDAKADWRAGRMKLPDLDDQEFIPLP